MRRLVRRIADSQENEYDIFMRDDEQDMRQKRVIQLLQEHKLLTRSELESLLGETVATSTLQRDLSELEAKGVIKQKGKGRATGWEVASKENIVGQLINTSTTKVTASTQVINDEEPLVEVKVTNPISYLKRWWQKVIGNEGIKIKFSLEIKPLTAIGMVLILTTLGLGLTTVGAMLKHLPFYAQFQQFLTAPDNSRELALEGRLYGETGSDRYYLFTANRNEAVGVRAVKLDLSRYDDLHVIVTGKYNEQTNLLTVETVREVGEVKQPTESELAPKSEPSPAVKMEVETKEGEPASGSGEWRE